MSAHPASARHEAKRITQRMDPPVKVHASNHRAPPDDAPSRQFARSGRYATTFAGGCALFAGGQGVPKNCYADAASIARREEGWRTRDDSPVPEWVEKIRQSA